MIMVICCFEIVASLIVVLHEICSASWWIILVGYVTVHTLCQFVITWYTQAFGRHAFCVLCAAALESLQLIKLFIDRGIYSQVKKQA